MKESKMPEIKCPKCGEVFTVDESGYAAIVSQIKDAEFHKELCERVTVIEKNKENEISLIKSEASADKEKSISELKQEIERLNAKINSQLKDYELDKERALNLLKQENEQLKAKIENNVQERTLAITTAVSEKKDELVEKEKQILQLENQLKEAEKDKQIQEQY